MFGKFKDKLKGWFKDSSEKIEEEAKVVETEKEKEKIKLEKEIKRAEKIIEGSKEEKGQNVPSKFDAYNRKTIPDLEKIEEEEIGRAHV